METIENIGQKRRLAQMLMQRAAATPATVKPGEPAANAFQPLIQILAGKLQDKRLEKQEQEALERRQSTINEAFSEETPRSGKDIARVLMGNPDTYQQGVALQLEDTKRRAVSEENALNRQNALMIARENNLAKRETREKKPMPASALKMQQEELDQMSTAGSINADMKALENQLNEGKLDLGPVQNMISEGRNAAGLSTDTSKNYASFRASLEKMRNDSLRLNKGVQTEGDAIRAWNELFKNITDPGVVKQRLGEIQKANQRAASLRKMNIDVIRANYGLDPMDTSNYQNPSPAVGGPSGDLSADEQKELQQLRQRFGRK